MDQVVEFFSKLFDVADWPPRWHCGRWTEFHGWLYIISDLLIWSAYFSIPLVILKYISRRQDVRFIRLYFLFAAFILACGATHFLDAVAFWVPAYRLSALVRLVTGVISWITVFYLVRFLPLAFSLKSHTELENEIYQRKIAEEEIRQLNIALEQRVLERTEELSQSEQKYRHLFENNPMPMWIIDIDSFRFLAVNEVAVAHYGYSREEFLSMTAFDIRPPEEVSRFKNAHHPPSVSPGQYNRGLWRHRKKDGTDIQVEIIAHDISFEGKKGRLILANDVTDKIRATEALHKLNEELENRVQQRTIQLETVNKELEAFSYSVSHDLRAPLRGIIGFTTMLEEDYTSKLDDEAKRLTSIIKNNTLRMGLLIDGLLSFSRMTRKDIVMTEIDTQKMVNDMVADLAGGNTIEWDIQSLPAVKGDYYTLQQVWINLISNAVKYSGTRERPFIQIGSFMQDKQVVFFVKDNGVGFDNKYKEKLFKVFQRLHSADEFEGTGVGLALVEKIITKHGGKVWADAVPNEGACFYFSLPADIVN